MHPLSATTPARVFWLIAAAVWLCVIAALVNAGFQPDYWQLRFMDGGTLPYPTRSVVNFALLSTVELVVAALVVRPWRFHRLWLRLLIAFALMLLWSLPWAMVALHQPPVQGTHLLWLLLLDLMMLVALCGVSLLSALRAWMRRSARAG